MNTKIGMNRRGFYTGILILLVWMAGAAVAGIWEPFGFLASDEGLATETHFLYGFSVDYPARWVVSQYGENGSRGNKPLKMSMRLNKAWTASFVMFYYRSAEFPSLDEAEVWARSVYSPIRGPNITESVVEDDVLRGHAIRRGIFHYGEEVPLVFDAVLIPRQDSIVLIILKTPADEYEDHVADFEAVVASFRPLD